MSNYIATTEELTAVADAIRSKGGTTEQLTFPTGFVDAIGAIQTGGGDGGSGGSGERIVLTAADSTAGSFYITINMAINQTQVLPTTSVSFYDDAVKTHVFDLTPYIGKTITSIIQKSGNRRRGVIGTSAASFLNKQQGGTCFAFANASVNITEPTEVFTDPVSLRITSQYTALALYFDNTGAIADFEVIIQ